MTSLQAILFLLRTVAEADGAYNEGMNFIRAHLALSSLCFRTVGIKVLPLLIFFVKDQPDDVDDHSTKGSRALSYKGPKPFFNLTRAECALRLEAFGHLLREIKLRRACD